MVRIKCKFANRKLDIESCVMGHVLAHFDQGLTLMCNLVQKEKTHNQQSFIFTYLKHWTFSESEIFYRFALMLNYKLKSVDKLDDGRRSKRK